MICMATECCMHFEQKKEVNLPNDEENHQGMSGLVFTTG